MGLFFPPFHIFFSFISDFKSSTDSNNSSFRTDRNHFVPFKSVKLILPVRFIFLLISNGVFGFTAGMRTIISDDYIFYNTVKMCFPPPFYAFFFFYFISDFKSIRISIFWVRNYFVRFGLFSELISNGVFRLIAGIQGSSTWYKCFP